MDSSSFQISTTDVKSSNNANDLISFTGKEIVWNLNYV